MSNVHERIFKSNLYYLLIDLPLASPPSAAPIRLLIDQNSIKLLFIFVRLASTCPRVGRRSALAAFRRVHAADKAHFCTRISVINSPW